MPRPQDFGALPGASLNRAKYSDPDHVLHYDCAKPTIATGWGIYTFAVSDVLAQTYEVRQPQPRRLSFFVQHVPLPECKAHSEIHCHDATSHEAVRPSAAVRNLFRIFVTQNCSVIRVPSA
jgi:hypothetical protein